MLHSPKTKSAVVQTKAQKTEQQLNGPRGWPFNSTPVAKIRVGRLLRNGYPHVFRTNLFGQLKQAFGI